MGRGNETRRDRVVGAGHMEANLPTHPECQKACQIRPITYKSHGVAISYNNEARLMLQ